MTYKNGIKEYSMITLLFGCPMGLWYGLIGRSVIKGVISAVFSGCLFTLLVFLFIKTQEKMYDKMRIGITEERKLICDGVANYQGNGGWLFFTEQGLEFYPHKINFSQKELMIPISAIKSAKTKKNQLIVETTDNSTSEFLVSHNKEWAEQIKQYIAV